MPNLALTFFALRLLAAEPEVFGTFVKSLSVSFVLYHHASGLDTFLFVWSVIYIVHSNVALITLVHTIISFCESTFYGRLQATVIKSSATRKYNRFYGQVADKAVGEAPN